MSQCGIGVSPSKATGSISTHFCANVLSLGTCANRILGLQNLKNLSGFSPESVNNLCSRAGGNYPMDNSLNYAEIIKKTVNAATIDQPSIQAIKLYPVCDVESGNFVVLATGFDKQQWMDNVIFHARLIEKDNCDPQIIIEEDNFEEGLVDTLIEAGIKKEDIVIS